MGLDKRLQMLLDEHEMKAAHLALKLECSPHDGNDKAAEIGAVIWVHFEAWTGQCLDWY